MTHIERMFSFPFIRNLHLDKKIIQNTLNDMISIAFPD